MTPNLLDELATVQSIIDTVRAIPSGEKGEVAGLRVEATACVNFLRTNAPALADMAKRLEAAERKYGELIFSVASKFPGESPHETALRYIRNAETATAGGCQAAIDATQEGEG